LFRRRLGKALAQAHDRAELRFFGENTPLADAGTFAQWLAPMRQCKWVVYAKRPFAGPIAVLACLSCYTHCVAIWTRRKKQADAARANVSSIFRRTSGWGQRPVLLAAQLVGSNASQTRR